VILLFLALDEHVVHIYLYIPPNLLTEHLVYQPLVCGSCVLQAEWHDPVIIEPLASDKGSLLLIFFCHLNLVILEKVVYKGEKLVPCCRVHKLVNPR